VDDGSVTPAFADRILDRVERAQGYADRGRPSLAVRSLEQAINRARAGNVNARVRRQVVAVLDDLVDWQSTVQAVPRTR
jgi:hypothetical protein